MYNDAMQKIFQNGWAWVVIGLLVGGVGGYIYFNRDAQQKCVYDAVREQRLEVRPEDGTKPFYETQGAAEVLRTVRTFVNLVATGEVEVAPESQHIYTALKDVLDQCGVSYN